MRWSVSPTRVPDWNWNWTAVRPERYIFLNILVTVRDRLVTQPCHLPATTHYVPTTLPGYVAGHGRAVLSTFRRYTRAIFLLLFLFSFYIYIYIHTSALERRIFPTRLGKKTLPVQKPSASPSKEKASTFGLESVSENSWRGQTEREREGEIRSAAIVTWSDRAIPIPGKTISISSS